MTLAGFKSEIKKYINEVLRERGLDGIFEAGCTDEYFTIQSKKSIIPIVKKLFPARHNKTISTNIQIGLEFSLEPARNRMLISMLQKEKDEEKYMKNVKNRIYKNLNNSLIHDYDINLLISEIAINDDDLVTMPESFSLKPILDKDVNFIKLDHIEIEKFSTIVPKVILDLAGCQENYFIGENGDGKTLLLQAILIGLKSRTIAVDAEIHDVSYILDLIRANNLFSIFISQEKFSSIFSYESYSTNKYSPVVHNVYAYGVHRSQSADPNRGIDKLGFGTLFDDGSQNIYLCSPTDWLKEKQRLELSGHNTGISFETAKNILHDIVDHNIEIEIGKDVIFKERGTPVSFHQLSEGYKSVMTWVVDLLYRMGEDQPEAKSTQDFEGIVMVDEINLHLHPKWEYGLVRKLRELLPKVQFIFTTHSPVTILGASEDALFFKVYKDENGHTCVTEAEELRLQNMRLDQILTSDFFGLASARPRHLQGFMERRRQILSQRELTAEDEAELKALEAKNGALPTGETVQEIKTMLLLEQLLQEKSAH